ALYTLLSPMTALREANQVGSLQPTTLVSYEADIGNVFDGTEAGALAAEGMDAADLADPGWRDQMAQKGEAKTQGFACRLADQGYHGILVPSYAPGAGTSDLNLVLWVWGQEPPARLVLIDDEKRLSR